MFGMIRRQFLAGAGALAFGAPALAALPVPAGGKIAFKVLRNGSVIGDHDLTFSQSGDDLTVAINVALVVKILGITAFTYSLVATERWSAGVFEGLESNINNNGTQLEVQAHKTADGYLVNGINHSNPAQSYPEYTAPPNTLPLTYWNKAMLNANILNIQTAHSYPAMVSSPGWFKIPTADGGTLVAQRFDLTGKLHLSVWYDQTNAWSGLEFHVNGDETYQKIMS
jgi:hypothetical protein